MCSWSCLQWISFGPCFRRVVQDGCLRLSGGQDRRHSLGPSTRRRPGRIHLPPSHPSPPRPAVPRPARATPPRFVATSHPELPQNPACVVTGVWFGHLMAGGTCFGKPRAQRDCLWRTTGGLPICRTGTKCQRSHYQNDAFRLGEAWPNGNFCAGELWRCFLGRAEVCHLV